MVNNMILKEGVCMSVDGGPLKGELLRAVLDAWLDKCPRLAVVLR